MAATTTTPSPNKKISKTPKLVGKLSSSVQVITRTTITTEEYNIDLKICPEWLDIANIYQNPNIRKSYGDCELSSGSGTVSSNKNGVGRHGILVMPYFIREEGVGVIGGSLSGRATEIHLSLTVLIPDSIKNKTLKIKCFDVDFITEAGTIVSPHPSRSQEQLSASHPKKVINGNEYNSFRSLVDCSAGRKRGDPSVDLIRLTFYIEFEEEKPLSSLIRLNPEVLSDVVISCEGKDFQAHRALLGMASPVFLNMFTTEMKESKENRVEVDDFDKETIDLMLQWIYSGELDLNEDDFDTVVKLFQAAHKYCMEPFKDYLAAQIVEHHTKSETAVEMFEFGHLYENNAIIKKAKSIIKKQKRLVFANKSIYNKYMTEYPDFMEELLFML